MALLVAGRDVLLVLVLVALMSGGVTSGVPALSWSRSASQGDDLMVRPMFMLKHAPGAMKQLDNFVAEVSTPGRPKYGSYLDMAALRNLFPVAKGAKEAVLAFLVKHGVDDSKISISASGDMVQAEVSKDKARVMFNTEFHQYEHPRTQRRIVRAASGYTTPAQIQAHVYLVGNLAEFPNVQRPARVEESGESMVDWGANFGSDCGFGCGGRVTPGVLAARYNLSASTEVGVGSGDTSMATAEFQGVYYDTSSLQHFQSECGLKQQIQVDQQIGTNVEWHCSTGSPCTEALLDIEYAKAASGGINLTNIFNDDYSLLNWAKQVDDLGDSGPSVHSVSYGDDEIQQGDDAPSGMSGKAYMEATNAQFAKLAARGISVMVSSGDQGVCGRSGCARRFHPGFPASSPYVTAVGGTDFAVRSVIGEEQAWSNSGGGFSDEFDTPAWQQQAVQGYLAAAAKAGNLPDDDRFNRKGRAFPDVSALGGDQNPFCVSEKILPFVEKMQGVWGTSASCPVFAGIVARLNQARLAAALPRMGLMNPWIYKHPEVFHDVTKGANGFTAMTGWDPATGMGTPSFDKMLRVALEREVLVV